jgi:ligand-binding SRPBCC domain-containing protein
MQTHRDSFILRAPAGSVFDFYTNLENLARMASGDVTMRVARAETPLRLGSRVHFVLGHRAFPMEVRWEAEITAFEPGRLFEDRQVKGPFEHWVHRHEFEQLGDGRTMVTDTIEVGAPMGVFGRLAERLLVGHKIDELFRQRREVLRRELEPAAASPAAASAP